VAKGRNGEKDGEAVAAAAGFAGPFSGRTAIGASAQQQRAALGAAVKE